MKPSMFRRSIVPVTMAGALVFSIPAAAETVSINPSKDNTLYEDAAGSLSNGAGQHIFAGRSGVTSNNVRRAVLAFDIAGNIPAGATIDSATLTLHLSQAPFGATGQTFGLHRLLADWGEGTSDAAFQEGRGAAATAGDATWLHRFHATQLWTTPGGDFSPTVSASRSVGEVVGFYALGSTAQMVADVQNWLDIPASNFGWILRGVETELQTARRFDSRQNPEPTFRPVLTVEFSVASVAAGRVPDGASVPGTPLTLAREANGDVTLTWGLSCSVQDDDYEIYEGTLGSFASHTPRFCSTAGATTMTFTPTAGSDYYLVVPRNAGAEGSYGTESSGTERPRSASGCVAQSIETCR